MEKESPALPPEKGVRMMKMRPGIVIRPLKRKNQRRLPIRSNTRPRLPRPAPARQRRMLRLTVMAVNIETSTPMIRTRAKPRIVDDPKEYRMPVVMRLGTVGAGGGVQGG